MAARVMVIEFDHTLSRDLANTLKGLGYDVVTSPGNGQGAWDPEPDLLVVDVPNGREREISDKIQALQAAHAIPAILLTAEASPSPIDLATSFVPLIKPLAAESLHNLLDLVLHMRKSEQRWRQKAARLSHTIATLKEAQTQTRTGCWEEYLFTNELHVSPECLNIHQLPPSPPPRTLTPLLDTISTEDRARVEQLLKVARKEGGTYETEYRVMQPGGSERIVSQRVLVHRDENGRPFRLISTVRDVTEERRTETDLRQSELRASQLLRERDFLLENTRDVLYYIDEQWNIYYISPAVEQISGYTLEEWRGPFTAHLADTPNNRRAIAETMEIMRTGRRYPPTDIDVRHKNGGILTIEVNEQPIVANGKVIGIVGVARDVTEKRQAERRLTQGTAVFDNMLEAVMITDADRCITAVNRSFAAVTGYEEAEVLGRTPDFLNAGLDEESQREKVWAEVAQIGHWAGEMWYRRKSGEPFPAWAAISTISDQAGRITNYVILSSDLSRIRESEEKLDRLAHYDPLTRLPNRLLFNARLSHAIRSAERREQPIAILFIDLDHFKSVNDTLGHPAGDRLLQEVAHRLTSSLRSEDTVAHLGGDEFVVILEDFKDQRYLASVAQKLLDTLRHPYMLNGHEAVITASVGISLYPRDGEDVTRLVQTADTAMYRAKELGRAKFQFYTADLTRKAVERMTLANAMRSAPEKGEFVLYYQPQLSLTTGSVVGVEALIRWDHPERGLLPPKAFISLGEETGQIVAIGEWVLRTACAQVTQWESAGAGPVRMAINLSALQLADDVGLVGRVGRILLETGANPNQIEFEITESAIMRNAEAAAVLLNELKALGVHLAIDDFGTGYSSMSYLKTFSVDRLKVDASFVHDLPEDMNDREIVRAMIALGHTLQMTVIAEGVETQEQQSFLHDSGCDEMQGFLFSAPLTEPQCRELLLHRPH